MWYEKNMLKPIIRHSRPAIKYEGIARPIRTTDL